MLAEPPTLQDAAGTTQAVKPEPSPDDNPAVWRARIEEDIKYLKGYDTNAENRKRAMLGTDYIPGMSGDTKGQEPLWWRSYRSWVPKIGFANPAFTIKSDNPGGAGGLYGFIAEADEAAINQNIKKAKLGQELTELADDTYWGRACTLRKMVPVPEDAHLTEPAYDENGQLLPPAGKPRMMGKSFRIRPSWTFLDHRNGRRRYRWAGHMEVLHIDEARSQVDENGLPLYPEAGLTKLAATKDASGVRNGAHNGWGTCGNLQEGELVLYHVWCRRTRMIYTLGYSRTEGENEGRFLRKTRYFGPAEGPYTFYGACWLADYVLPLPMSVIMNRIIELMQAHRAKAERDAATAKEGVVTGSKSAQKKIIGGKNNAVWHIPGAKKDNTFNLAVGGPQEATEKHLARLEYEYQLVGGQSLALSGNPDSGASATADALAAQQAEEQGRFARENFMLSISEDIMGWLWFYHEATEVNPDVTIGDPASGEMVTLPYRGTYQGRIDVPLSSLEMQIDPHSVGFSTPAETDARSNRVNQQIAGILEAARRYPELETENIMQDTLDRMDTRGGYQRYVNVPLHRMIKEQAAAAAVGLGMGGGMGGMDAGGGSPADSLKEPAPQRTPGANPGRSAGSSAGGKARANTPGAKPRQESMA